MTAGRADSEAMAGRADPARSRTIPAAVHRAIAATPLVGLAGLVLAGLAGTVVLAFGHLPAIDAEGWSLDPWRRLLAMPGLATSIALSAAAGLVSTLVALAVVTTTLAGWWGTRTAAVLLRFLSPLLSVPHAAAAVGLAFLVAPSGWILRLLSPWATGSDRPPDYLLVGDPLGLAMIGGLVVKEVPFLMLVALAALPQADPARALAVGASLGYGRSKTFWVAVVPRLLPALRLPVLAVAAYASAAVDVAMILGPTTPAPLAVRILEWAGRPDLSLRLVASAGALLQLGVTAAVLATVLAILAFVRRAAVAMAADGRRRRRDGFLRVAAAVSAGTVVVVLAAAILSLAVWSFAGAWAFPDAWPAAGSLTAWRRVGPALLPALAETVAIGLLASLAAAAVLVVWLYAETRDGRRPAGPWSLVLFLPLLVPDVAYLFGLDVLAAAAGLEPGRALVLAGHLLYVLPYVYLSLSGPWLAFDPRWTTVAATLGAGPWRSLWAVRLPMLAVPLATAVSIGFAVSVALYLPTVVLGAGRVATVTTETVALAAGADRRTAGAAALVQSLLPFLGFAIVAVAVRVRGRAGSGV